MINKMKLLVTDKVDAGGLESLRNYFDIDFKVGLSENDLAKIIGDYEAIITRTSTPISKKLIDQAKKLKIIGRSGIGVDNIDIFAATRKNIAVFNAPLGNSLATAEHAIELLFQLLGSKPKIAKVLKKISLRKQKFSGFKISGKTLGIVGFGSVGKKVYEIATALGLKVIVCEPYINLPKNVRKATYEELLAECDIITFHVPATYLTRKMLNRHTLALCKKGVYIVNCSRADVIDEVTIIEGLRSGKIAGYAVNVATSGSKLDPTLLNFTKVIFDSRLTKSTDESQQKSIEEVVFGIIQYVKGKPPGNLLNPQVFHSKRKRRLGHFGFETIVFDCDSTLSAIEGIVELSKFAGKEAEIDRITQQVIEGDIPFESVFEKRLELVKPTRDHIQAVGIRYIETLVEDAKGVVEALLHLKKQVYIVSGGYTPALLKLGKYLGIPSGNIFGNDLIFDTSGRYVGSIGGPLRRNWGKLQILRGIPGRKLMVGDSITDLETKECVDLFVGYGGVKKVTKVEKECQLYINCQSLAPIIVIAAGVDGCIKLLSTKYQRYIGKGLDLLFHARHAKFDRTVHSYLSNYKRLAYY